jgi:hypothetical protein
MLCRGRFVVGKPFDFGSWRAGRRNGGVLRLGSAGLDEGLGPRGLLWNMLAFWLVASPPVGHGKRAWLANGYLRGSTQEINRALRIGRRTIAIVFRLVERSVKSDTLVFS